MSDICRNERTLRAAACKIFQENKYFPDKAEHSSEFVRAFGLLFMTRAVILLLEACSE
jgi:hypothetical protein